MSKFCMHCGAELEEDSVFCLNCGVAVAPAAPAVPTPMVAPPENPSVLPKDKRKKSPAAKVFIGVAVIAAVALVFFLFSMAFSHPYTDALDNHFMFVIQGDEDAFEALAPKEYWDYREDENDTSVRDLYKQTKEYSEERWDFNKDFYGKDLTFSYNFTKVNQFSDNQVKMCADYLHDTYDIDDDEVTRAYRLYFDISIRGEDGTDEYWDYALCVIEIDGVWYPCNIGNVDGEARVEFNP